MTDFEWNSKKDEKLIGTRGISFKMIVEAFENNQVLKIIDHPNQVRFKGQKMMIVNINSYIYVVPYVVKDNGVRFLKTIIPSRKATKQYLSSKKEVK